MEEEKKKSKVLLVAGSKSSNKSVGSFGGRSISRLKVRKQSYGFSSVPGIKTTEAMIQMPADLKRPVLAYLNTYQLNPSVKFNPVPIEKVANSLLDDCFTGYKYSAQDAPNLALTLSGVLMRTVKAMNFNRYRIIAVVTVGQKRAQGYINAISFLWDHERDKYMNVQREVHTAFIQITVFGIYLD